MSNEVLTWVFDNSPTVGGERLVLIALADYADKKGECYPSVLGVAKKAGMGERGARKCLRKLEAAGHIRTQVNRGAGYKNRYTVLMENRNAGTGLSDQETGTLGPDKTGTVVPLSTSNKPEQTCNKPEQTCNKPEQTCKKTGTPVPPNPQETLKEPLEVDPPLIPLPDPKPPPKALLPADWCPSSANVEYAKSQGLTETEIQEIADDFRGYWSERRDAKAKKTQRGWDAAWRNRIIDQAPRYARNRNARVNAGTGRPGQGTAQAFAAVAAQLSREQDRG